MTNPSLSYHKYVFLLILFLEIGNHAYSQKREKWNNLTINQGLIDNYVECLMEDNQGFLWIGTWSGISRFDGVEFKQYRKGISDSTSLPGNWIYTIYQDKSGIIWAGTDEGLARYNPVLNIFQTIPSIENHSIVSIKEDSKGNIWVAGDNQLYQIDPKTNRLIFHQKFERNPKEKSFEIGALCIDKKDVLWIGTSDQGILRSEIKNTKRKDIQEASVYLKLSNDPIKQLEVDSDGSLWVGTLNEGLFHVNSETPIILQHFTHQTNPKASIAHNRIRSIYKDSQKNIWVVNPNGFINQLNKKGNQFERQKINPQLSYEDIPTSCFIMDRNGNEWIGTHGNGILNRNRQKEKFINIATSSLYSPGHKVSSFLSHNEAGILVGTDGNGLNCFDPKTNRYSAVDIGTHLRTSKILSIKNGVHNEIWLSFWANGIASIDYKSFRLLSHYNGKSKDSTNLTNCDIKGILVDDSLIWISSNGDGIFLYNHKKKKFISRNSSIAPFDLERPKWGNGIFKDSRERIWIPTSKGLFLFTGKSLQHFVHDIKKNKSIGSNLILTLYEDKKKNIWILTDGGLELFNEQDQTFIHYSEKYRLPQQLKGITEDNKGNLWISSNEGITFFNPFTNKSIQYTMENGLPSNAFYHNAALTTQNGNLIFGSLNGFTFFHPDSLSISNIVSNVIFTDFQINYLSQQPSNKGTLQTHIQSSKKIILDYSTNVITFKFTSIDLCNPQNIRYSYLLSNQSNSWVDIGKQNFISFTNLSPGDYELKILARNINGNNAKKWTSIQLTILPPWYQSTAAYIGYVFFILIILYLIYHFLTLNLRTRNKLIMQRFEHRKKLELYQSKINFFTSISHDIRTPLTLIMAPLELLKEKIGNNNEAIKMLSILEKNANHLLQLTNELLEFKNLESGALKIKTKNTDIKKLIEEVITRFTNESLLKKITINFKKEECTAAIDRFLIEKALNNLLINAFKFTPNEGIIKITLSNNQQKIIISIYNSGSQIEDELRTKIFDPFFTTKTNQGFGLGLTIVKEIIHQHHGTIDIRNSEDGVVFTISIPKN